MQKLCLEKGEIEESSERPKEGIAWYLRNLQLIHQHKQKKKKKY